MQYQGLGSGVCQRTKPLPTAQSEREKEWPLRRLGQVLFQINRRSGSIHAQLADSASRLEVREYSSL